MSDRAVMPPQPPWVWGPSEVNAWIRAAYPSAARAPTRRAQREIPNVRRLRIRVVDAEVETVRAGIVEGLAAVGFGTAVGSRHRLTAKARTRRAVASIHHSMLWRGVVASIRFDPPVKRFSSRHLLHLFARRFHVVDVSADEA